MVLFVQRRESIRRLIYTKRKINAILTSTDKTEEQ